MKNWPDAGSVSLRYPQDYDIVVLAISLGEIPRICGQLIAKSPKWSAMVSHVKPVSTMALQLWLNKTTANVGGVQPPSIMTSFAQPLNTWADMTHLAQMETRAVPAKSIAYFCGPLNDVVDAPIRQGVRAGGPPLGRTLDWSESLPKIWPNFQQKYGLSPTDPMFDSPDIDDKFFRRNDTGSDLYVLSLPGSTKYRLAPDESGFTNLYLAGDWTRSGINIGCLESAVLSGLKAAKAVIDGKLTNEPADYGGGIVQAAENTISELASAAAAVIGSGAEAVLALSDLVFGGGGGE